MVKFTILANYIVLWNFYFSWTVYPAVNMTVFFFYCAIMLPYIYKTLYWCWSWLRLPFCHLSHICSAWQHKLCFYATRNLWCWRRHLAFAGEMTMSIRKQAIPLLHLDTGPPVRNPCSSDTVFHADDRIISSISVNQKGYEHLKTNLPQKKKTLFHFSCYLRSAILLFPFCHSVAAITFLILFPSPSHSPFLCPPTPKHAFFQSSGEVTDWLNICLSVGNEPANVANSACSIFICKPV